MNCVAAIEFAAETSQQLGSSHIFLEIDEINILAKFCLVTQKTRLTISDGLVLRNQRLNHTD